jgi:uncharacterized protein (TIGR01777 family)
MRTGIVLAKNGGALAQMITPFKLFVGGPIAGGEQYLSWIHIADMIKGIIFLLEKNDSRGVFNFTAPSPETNEEFSKKLAKVLNRPCIFRVPAIALETLYGEGAEIVVKGQKVFPARLFKEGYKFEFTDLDSALKDLLK